MDKRYYTLVECLEEGTDLFNYGSSYKFPVETSYIPTRNHILAKPNLLDNVGEDEGFRYNMSRISPYHYHNPLKAYSNRPLPEITQS